MYFMGCLHYMNLWFTVNPVMKFHYLHGFVTVWLKHSVDPDQLASDEASWARSTLFSKECLAFWKEGMCDGQIFAGHVVVCFIHLEFDIQHDHILKKKMNFGFGPTPLVHPGDIQALKLKSCLICFISIVHLSACEISVKNIDVYYTKREYSFYTIIAHSS